MINEKKLSAKIEALLEKHKTTSVQLAMIKDGKILLSEGYGYRDYENKLKTDENTVYAIGSSTKSFTGCAIAKLVEEGKLEWDKPVKSYLPQFEMYDKNVTEELLVIDILCHRCGLPRHEFAWYMNRYSTEEVIEKIKYLKPSAPFRHTLQYQNFMYALAGYLIEKITGKKWYEYIDETIVKPLGMVNTYYQTKDIQDIENKALPHVSMEQGIMKIPYFEFPIDCTLGAAGSMYSNAKNLLKWVELNLNKGKYNDKQIISEKEILECHKPQMINNTMMQSISEVIDMQSYGLGWFIESFKGNKIVYHGGNINGFSAMVAFIPSLNAGFAFLTNTDNSNMQVILLYALIDLLLGNEDFDVWNKKGIEYVDNMKSEMKQEQESFLNSCVKNSNPSFDIESYQGKYVNQAYGQIEIIKEESKLIFKSSMGSIPISHLCTNTFAAETQIAGIVLVIPLEFRINMTGQITKVMVGGLERAIKEGIEFKKVD